MVSVTFAVVLTLADATAAVSRRKPLLGTTGTLGFGSRSPPAPMVIIAVMPVKAFAGFPGAVTCQRYLRVGGVEIWPLSMSLVPQHDKTMSIRFNAQSQILSLPARSVATLACSTVEGPGHGPAGRRFLPIRTIRVGNRWWWWPAIATEGRFDLAMVF